MAYIYKIINDINQKIYIGKTEFSIQKRWNEHCNDYLKTTLEKRPLYAAMRKYGIEHFHIELIEETKNPEEREKYWIQYYNSFKNGYNATIGGDGKKFLDYDLIISLWRDQKLSIRQISKLLNCDAGQVSKILESYDISKEEKIKRKVLYTSNKVIQIDPITDKAIAIYDSIAEAERAMGNQNGSRHIGSVCLGKRKTAYKYKWAYYDTQKPINAE